MEPTARIDHTNYEQEDPRHVAEDEYWDRALERLERALRNIAEVEERMAHNIGQGLHPDRKSRG